MPLDLFTHKYRTDPQTGRVAISKVIPYRLFVAKGRPNVFLQNGVYYYENGEAIPDEKVTELGLDPKFKNGVPGRMKPHPKVEAILKASEEDEFERFANEIAARRPVIKRTVVVNSMAPAETPKTAEKAEKGE